MREITDLYSALLHSACNRPEQDAIVETSRRWTYHELLMAVDRAADMFWGLGVSKGDKVAVALRNSSEFIITNFALAKLGAVSVPVNFMITKPEELRFILSDCGAKGVVTQNDFLQPYLKLKTQLGIFVLATDPKPHSHAGDFWRLLRTSDYHAQAHNFRVRQGDTATILYTSGTTGFPKGVMLTHGNLITNACAAAQAFHVRHSDVFLCLLPMFHTFSWTVCCVIPLLFGTRLVIAPNITPARPWLQMMGSEGVTVMVGVPQIFSILAREARGINRLYLQYWAFRKVRCCFSGAAPLSVNTIEHFESALGIPLFEGYGLTETSPIVSANLPHARRHGSVGRALPDVRVRIIDEQERPLHRGEEGEICVKGPNITRGYYGNPAATKEIFTKDGWLKTGDIGVLDRDGFLYIRDRKKDMIIVKGLKVFSAQVEAVMHEHPAVAEAAVIGVKAADGEETIKCFCVLKPGAKADKSQLMRFAREKMDPYKRPRDIEIVHSLPKNSLNKVLKRTLRQQEAEKLKVRAAA